MASFPAKRLGKNVHALIFFFWEVQPQFFIHIVNKLDFHSLAVFT